MRLLKIGRNPSACDIVLNSPNVSGIHAEITLLNNGDIELEDKGSTNGTYIMNQRIKPGCIVKIHRGDNIRFADVELQWAQVPIPEDNSAYRAIYSIGSHFNNDIQLSGNTVSRYHATIKIAHNGKIYLIDHSKNGTTVDGIKVSPNTPFLLKKKNAVVCGGVPVDLTRLPWPTIAWKWAASIAAMIIVVVGLWLIIPHKKIYTDQELYDRYNKSVVMLKGIYHFEVKIPGMSDDDWNKFNNYAKYVHSKYGVDMYYLPQKFLLNDGSIIPADGLTEKQLIDVMNEVSNNKGMYSGTGFFVSRQGEVITNLHVAKPWLQNDIETEATTALRKQFAHNVEILDKLGLVESYTAYISQIKVEGKLDYIALVPQGEIFDADNLRKCKVIAAGDDLKKDVALIKMVAGETPIKCTYVNVKDSINTDSDALKVGERVITIGFPFGHGIQENSSENGLQVLCHSGKISQKASQYSFTFNTVSAGGASGSPIFNERGELIGILNAGIPGNNITYGIKPEYIKEILEQAHKQ